MGFHLIIVTPRFCIQVAYIRAILYFVTPQRVTGKHSPIVKKGLKGLGILLPMDKSC